MKLFGPQDLSLIGALTAALIVIFSSPILRMLDYAREIERQSGLTLIPALALLMVAFLFHQYRRNAQEQAKADAAEAATRAAQHRAAELERLVSFGQSLGRSLDFESIRVAIGSHLHELAGTDKIWVLVREGNKWQALSGDTRGAEQVLQWDDLAEQLLAGADQAPAEPSAPRAIGIPLIVGGTAMGVLGVTTAAGQLPADKRRILEAAAALLALCRPAMGSVNDTSPHGVASSTRACARSSNVTSTMRTVAALSSPNVMTRAEVRDCMANTRSSSAFKMATPSLGNASTSSPLARAMPSRLSSSALCASATAVTTPIFGRPTSVSRVISPWPRMPISSTNAWQSSGALSNVMGTPWSLLNERELAATFSVDPIAAAAKSLVVVLPTEPVMPTTRCSTRPESCSRAQRPSLRRASMVSGTTIAVPRRGSRDVR